MSRRQKLNMDMKENKNTNVKKRLHDSGDGGGVRTGGGGVN